MSLLTPIPPEKQEKRGWQFQHQISGFQLTNPRFGTLSYGLTSAGYDGWIFEEAGGGGSVIVPYVKVKGQLFIGLVQQERFTMGGKVWNVPRGFLDPGETHFEAAKRESSEELGFDLSQRFKELSGQPTNPNSAFFVTGEGKGVRFYGLELKPTEVEKHREHPGSLQFKPGVLQPKPANKLAEQIFGSRFMPFWQAVEEADMFTLAGAARVLRVAIPKLGI